MSNAKLEAKIAELAREGCDPLRFVKSMAPFFKVSAEEYVATVQRLALPIGPAIDIHTQAQMNRATERSFARQDPAARRAFDHEED